MEKILLKDIAYEKIKEQIISNAFPPSMKLEEGKIAKMFEMSRTPVREAFVRLEKEGLVVIYPQSGVFVKELTIKDIINLSQVRAALEGMAARLACGNIDMEKLDDIHKKLLEVGELKSKKDILDSYVYGSEIHAIIEKYADNDLIGTLLRDVEMQFDRIKIFSREIPDRYALNYKEHINIIEALKKNDKDEAELAIRRHIDAVKDDAIKLLQESRSNSIY